MDHDHGDSSDAVVVDGKLEAPGPGASSHLNAGDSLSGRRVIDSERKLGAASAFSAGLSALHLNSVSAISASTHHDAATSSPVHGVHYDPLALAAAAASGSPVQLPSASLLAEVVSIIDPPARVARVRATD